MIYSHSQNIPSKLLLLHWFSTVSTDIFNRLMSSDTDISLKKDKKYWNLILCWTIIIIITITIIIYLLN